MTRLAMLDFLAAVVLGGIALALWQALRNFPTPGAERVFTRAIGTACSASLILIAVGLV